MAPEITVQLKPGADAPEFTLTFPDEQRSEYVREYLRTLRFWEYGSHRRILQLARSRIPQGAFVDVGAGWGTESVLASEVFPVAYAFEVDPSMVPYLIRNLESNRVRACVVRQSVAEQSQKSVWVDQGRTRYGALYEESAEEATGGQLCETLALGDYPFEHEISFLHVDTEGMESQVLIGAARAIQKQGKTPFIRFTFHPARLKGFDSTAADLIKFFEVFQYMLFMSSPVQLAPISFTALQLPFDEWKNLSTLPWITLYAFPRDSQVYSTVI